MTNQTPPNNMQSTNDLIQKIHNLPPELFESVYDHYTTYSGPKTVVIDESYTFPAGFRVNKSIRQSFAENYFSKTTFICYNADILEKWLSVIPLGYQRLLKEVVYSPYEDEVFNTRESHRRLNMAIRNARPVMDRPAFALLRHGKLYLKIRRAASTELPGHEQVIGVQYVPF